LQSVSHFPLQGGDSSTKVLCGPHIFHVIGGDFLGLHTLGTDNDVEFEGIHNISPDDLLAYIREEVDGLDGLATGAIEEARLLVSPRIRGCRDEGGLPGDEA
jgi:hypothetical protein